MNLTREELEMGALASDMADKIVIHIAKLTAQYEKKIPEKHRAEFLTTALCLALGDLYEGREQWFVDFWRTMLESEQEETMQ